MKSTLRVISIMIILVGSLVLNGFVSDKVNGDSPSEALTPIARWDVVPYQRINADETLNLGVVAFSKNGIEKVEFTISGQGYSGGVKTATEMTLNLQSGVWEYWVPLSAIEFSSDGVINVEAVVYGNDGGVRDKNTDGGGVGLDSLNFTVNPHGTLPQPEAWVDVASSDTTGQVGHSELPFKTYMKAIQAISAMNGGTPQGGIVRLNQGTHSTSQQGGVWDTFSCPNEWVTITAAAGGTRENTILSGSAISNVAKVRLRGITLSGSQIINPSQGFGQTAVAWVDDCTLVGTGRINRGDGVYPGNNNPIGINFLTKYWTHSEISECLFATDMGWANVLSRDLIIHDIGEDVFRSTGAVINCTVDNCSPVISVLSSVNWIPSGHSSGHSYVVEKTGAFAGWIPGVTDDFFRIDLGSTGNPTSYGQFPQARIAGKISDDAIWLADNGNGEFPTAGTYDGWLTKGYHSDVWQWVYSSESGGMENNIIIYGLKATNTGYQGISDNSWFSNPDQAVDIAFVNVYMQRAPYGSYWMRCTDNMLMWHCTFDERMAFFPDVDGAGQHQWSPITNLSVKGCCFAGRFYDFLTGTAHGSIDWVDCDQNHYRYTASGNQVTPGTNFTTGNPGLDSYGRPNSTSVLLNRISPLIVLIDADNNLRDSQGDVGAYEYLAGGGPTSTGLTPIARWDVVLYQRINAGETLNLGVVAFSKNGINRVEFTISGQGYSGEIKTATEMTLNLQTGVYEYWVPVSASEFSIDGVITVEATVYGNDGGVRDKTTGGGGQGLDALNFTANPLGSLPTVHAWVDVSGSDTTGVVNDVTHPFATIGHAAYKIQEWMNSHGYGNKADGGIIYLNEGSHAVDNGGHWTPTITVGEWLTITRASGALKANTKITSRVGYWYTDLLRVRDITLDNSANSVGFLFEPTTPNTAMVWIDTCVAIGPGRLVANRGILSENWPHVSWTDSTMTDISGFCPTAGGGLMRGLTLIDIGFYAFRFCPMVVNCTVDNLDPGDTGYHADMWQLWGTSPSSWENFICYNLRGTNLHYQGFMVRTGSVSQSAHNFAFVNVYCELVEPIRWEGTNGGSNCWFRSIDHFLLWHCTFIGGIDSVHGWSFGDFCIYNDPADNPVVITNFDAVGNCFYRLMETVPGGSVNHSLFAHNHYVVPTSGGIGINPGTDVTTGDPMLGSYGRPNASSPLRDRISPLLVPIDAGNNLRDSNGDVGAYEYQNGGIENQPPNTPSNPSPTNHDTATSITTDLNWTGEDPDEGDTVTYDVYFEAGDSTPDVLVSNDQTSTTYDLGTLAYSTHYYWQINATDNHGASTLGPVWDFTTQTQTVTPAVTTNDPTGIGGTNVTMNGVLSDDGGEACTVDFQYGLTSSYGSDTSNQVKNTGQTFSVNQGSLSKGTYYHYRARAVNSGGTGYGSDITFLTKPDPLTEFSVTPLSKTVINLTWSNSAGGDGAYIEYTTASAPNPWNPGMRTKIGSDGYVAGTSFQHTSLIPQTHYYYKAWAYADDASQKSNGSATKPFGDTPMTGDGWTNGRPVITNPIPANNATDIPITTTVLRIQINDSENDLFNWSIETSPDIGNASGTNARNGTKNCTISGLSYSTTYYWFVNATDSGSGNWTNETYWFTTEDEPDYHPPPSGPGYTPPENQPPKANAGGPYTGLVNQSIMLNASKSHDDGTIVSYSWSFGDTHKGYGRLINHTYNQSGNYTINLTVKDNDGASNMSSTYAFIAELEPQQPPVSNKTTNQSTMLYVGDLGYLIDQDNDGIYDMFYCNETGNQTEVQKQEDGTYLIDTNGDGVWNYFFDPTTKAVVSFTTQKQKETPGFELLIFLSALLIILVWKRKKQQ